MLVTVNQSKRTLCSRDLFGGRKPVNTSKFIEGVHNCPAVRDVSSIAYKDTRKTQGNEGASGQTWFRPNLSSFLPLIRFFFLFFFTTFVLRECHCTNKSTMLKITVCCNLTPVWLKERVCQLFEVFQHEFANLNLPCEGRFRNAMQH